MKNDRDYGKGAADFALQFIEGLSQVEALPVLIELNKGDLHDVNDKRIKRCDYCEHLWRDGSLRNTKRTCSEDCRRSIRTMQRQEQRANQALLNPEPKKEKRTLMDDYIWWVENPFWINEYSMMKIGWKHEESMSVAKMDYIGARTECYGKGNRRKPKVVPDYNGDGSDKF